MSANNMLGGEEEEAKVLVIALLLVAAIEAVASPYGGCSLAADSSMKRHTSRSNRIDLALRWLLILLCLLLAICVELL
jgi:hypothetical protein